MSGLGPLKLVGSARVSFSAPATAVFLSTSGAFGAISAAASIVTILALAAGRQFAPGDVIQATSNGVIFGAMTVNRALATEIEVRTFDDAGALQEEDFDLDWYSVAPG